MYAECVAHCDKVIAELELNFQTSTREAETLLYQAQSKIQSADRAANNTIEQVYLETAKLYIEAAMSEVTHPKLTRYIESNILDPVKRNLP